MDSENNKKLQSPQSRGNTSNKIDRNGHYVGEQYIDQRGNVWEYVDQDAGDGTFQVVVVYINYKGEKDHELPMV